MSDLVKRLRSPASAPNWATADRWMIEAADEIERQQNNIDNLRVRIDDDQALLRQALAYILSDGDFLNPDSVEATRQLIAALRERLGEKS